MTGVEWSKSDVGWSTSGVLEYWSSAFSPLVKCHTLKIRHQILKGVWVFEIKCGCVCESELVGLGILWIIQLATPTPTLFIFLKFYSQHFYFD
jgi:hypothetical protein